MAELHACFPKSDKKASLVDGCYACNSAEPVRRLCEIGLVVEQDIANVYAPVRFWYLAVSSFPYGLCSAKYNLL
jgi:hypothetical protein